MTNLFPGGKPQPVKGPWGPPSNVGPTERGKLWRGQPRRIDLTQDASLIVKFPFATPSPDLAVYCTFQSSLFNDTMIAIGNREIVAGFPSSNCYAELAPGQWGRVYVDNFESEAVDLGSIWCQLKAYTGSSAGKTAWLYLTTWTWVKF